jgi:DNA-binding MarR family transcriptional regulator
MTTTDFAREEILYQAIRLVRPIHLNVARTVERQVEGTGVSMPMRAVLESLLECGPSTIPQVARRLSLKRQFIQRIMADALKGRLVKKQPNPDHRRAFFFTVTAKGRAAFTGIHTHELAILKDRLHTISRADAEATLRVMRQVSALFEELAGPHGPDTLATG